MSKPKLIVILGPTATGKTHLAVNLASQFNGEIISADSRQIYQGLNIGTGKDLTEYKNIPYHLIDIIKPNDLNFNLAKYKKLALQAIADIQSRGKIPFLVGGTGLYISSIVNNYNIPEVKPNKIIRKTLNKLNLSNKLKLLKKLDPKALDLIDIKNERRVNRALEICLSRQKFSKSKLSTKSPFDILQIGLTLPRKELNTKIDQRVDKMIQQGLLDEIKSIQKKYSGKNIMPKIIGYKEILDFINKKTNLEKAVDLIKTHTHQYAKRQMTWFRRNKNIHWIKNKPETEKLIKNFLSL